MKPLRWSSACPTRPSSAAPWIRFCRSAPSPDPSSLTPAEGRRFLGSPPSVYTPLITEDSGSMTKAEVRARIAELAIIPAVRAAMPDDALFAAEAVSRGGLPIVELTMTVPNATELIARLMKKHPLWWSARERSWIWRQRAPAWPRGPNSSPARGWIWRSSNSPSKPGVAVCPGL